MEQYIPKSVVLAEIERRKRKLLDHIICERDKEWVVRTAHQLNRIIMFINTLEVKEDKEMLTSGECVTLSKERYQELLEYESVALWAFNVIIVASLPSIEDEKLKEISDDAKCKAVQAAFQEALKNKEDKK